MPHLSPTARVLFESAQRQPWRGPLDVIALVRSCPPDGPPEHDELVTLLDHVEQRLTIGVASTTPAEPGWQWTAVLLLSVLRPAVAGDPVALVSSTFALSRVIGSHGWHLHHYGHDPAVELRGRFADALARIVATSSPQSWSAHLFEPQPEPAEPAATVGQRIRRQRVRLAMTQEQLARALDVDRTTVVRWESGERLPAWRQRVRLAAVLGGTPATYDRLRALS